MHPVALRLGSFEVPTYGLFMALGAFAGAWLFATLARRAGADRGRAFEVIVESALVAMIAAKAAGFAAGTGPRTVESFVKSGGVWYVGFLVGTAYLAWRSPSLGLTALAALNRAAPAAALGHAIGRLGCLAAGCCWGRACELPWAVTFMDPRAHELTGVPLGVPLHPVQLYEALAELVLATGLVALLRARRGFDGLVALLYLLTYGLVRIGLELLRDDPRGGLGPFSTSQVLAAVVVVLAGVALAVLARRSARRADGVTA